MGKHTVTPWGLKANFLNKLIMLSGKVNHCSPVMTRLKKSTHHCKKTGKLEHKVYFDKLNIRVNEDQNKQGVTNVIPLTDKDNNPLTFEFGLSKYNDYQVLGVQESTENVPHGVLSRSIDVILQEDMVDKAKPGDRVQVIGILKPNINGGSLKLGSF